MAKDSVVKAEDYLEEVGKDYHGLDIPLYMFREWYSMVERFFFDCGQESLEACLTMRLKDQDYSHFRVFMIVDKEGEFSVKSISYPNIGNNNISSWVKRFEKTLKPSTLMSMSAAGLEFVEELGFSYRT